MKTKIAIRVLLSILIPLALFHLGVLLNIVPVEIIWGGRLNSNSLVYLLESISILVTLYLVMILSIKGKFLGPILPPKVVKISLWFFLILFTLNTIGNAFAKTTTEQIFALITLIISSLLGIVLKDKG
jgi:hypothetical protein